MKPKTQWIIAGVMAVVLLLVGVVYATGGKINIPGLSQNMAEIHFTGDRGWWSDPITITKVDVYSGIDLFSIGPFMFPSEFRVEAVASYRGRVVGSAVKVMSIEWWSGTDEVVEVGMENWNHGVAIELRLYDSAGSLRDTDLYTIP